jgi:folate-binding protein YgfZ
MTAYEIARRHAAIIDRTDRGRIAVSGTDRASYLQGLLTNDIATLKAGEGCYAAYLTAQGRMIADMFVYELGDVILLTPPRAQYQTVLAKLDQFVFSEDVQLGDLSETLSTLAVVGPGAAEIVSGVTTMPLGDLASLPEHGNRRITIDGRVVIVARVTDTGEPGYDLHVGADHLAAMRAALASTGIPTLDQETSDVLRIEAGVPRFGIDMNEETIPLEAGIESRAISLTKGCYVGQEVIIRVLHRGHGRVARKLVGLVIEGEGIPAPGAAASVDGREVGHLTSTVMSPTMGKPVALAYLQRDFVAPGTQVAVDGHSAIVTTLPFVQR